MIPGDLERLALASDLCLEHVDGAIMRSCGSGQYALQRGLVHFFIVSFGYLLGIPVHDLDVAPECCSAGLCIALGVDD